MHPIIRDLGIVDDQPLVKLEDVITSKGVDLEIFETGIQGHNRYHRQHLVKLLTAEVLANNAEKWFAFYRRVDVSSHAATAIAQYFIEEDRKISSKLMQVERDIYYPDTEWGAWLSEIQATIASVAFEKNVKPRLDKDIAVLLSKKPDLIYIDEYGDLIDAAWENEILAYCENKVYEPVLNYFQSNEDSIDRLCSYFPGFPGFENNTDLQLYFKEIYFLDDIVRGYMDSTVEKYDSDMKREDNEAMASDTASDCSGQSDLAGMSGHDYEHYLSERINNETTLHSQVTRGSGDQGADLIIRGIGLSAVVQAKLYTSKVSNKAVQEAYAARQYYNVGLAIVVANSGYTKSAYQLAERTGVLLFDEERLLGFLKAMLHKAPLTDE